MVARGEDGRGRGFEKRNGIAIVRRDREEGRTRELVVFPRPDGVEPHVPDPDPRQALVLVPRRPARLRDAV